MSEHLYLRKRDPAHAVTRYDRELHVCPAINPDGVHLAVRITDVRGDGETTRGAGINLTPARARKLVAHIDRILKASNG